MKGNNLFLIASIFILFLTLNITSAPPADNLKDASMPLKGISMRYNQTEIDKIENREITNPNSKPI